MPPSGSDHRKPVASTSHRASSASAPARRSAGSAAASSRESPRSHPARPAPRPGRPLTPRPPTRRRLRRTRRHRPRGQRRRARRVAAGHRDRGLPAVGQRGPTASRCAAARADDGAVRGQLVPAAAARSSSPSPAARTRRRCQQRRGHCSQASSSRPSAASPSARKPSRIGVPMCRAARRSSAAAAAGQHVLGRRPRHPQEPRRAVAEALADLRALLDDRIPVAHQHPRDGRGRGRAHRVAAQRRHPGDALLGHRRASGSAPAPSRPGPTCRRCRPGR